MFLCRLCWKQLASSRGGSFFYCFNLGLDGATCSWRRGSGGRLPYCSSQRSPTLMSKVSKPYVLLPLTGWNIRPGWMFGLTTTYSEPEQMKLVVITWRQRQQAQAQRCQVGLGFYCSHGGGGVQGNRQEFKQNVTPKLSADLLQRIAWAAWFRQMDESE